MTKYFLFLIAIFAICSNLNAQYLEQEITSQEYEKIYLNSSNILVHDDIQYMQLGENIIPITALFSDHNGLYTIASLWDAVIHNSCFNGHPIYHVQCGCAHPICPFRCKCYSPW